MASTVHGMLLIEAPSVWIKMEGVLNGKSKQLREEILLKISEVRFIETPGHLRVVFTHSRYERTEAVIETVIGEILAKEKEMALEGVTNDASAA